MCSTLSGDTPTDFLMCSTLSSDNTNNYPLYSASILHQTIRSTLPVDIMTDYVLYRLSALISLAIL
jgi:hypothetical protein